MLNKYLIVNADDFGIDEEIDRGIVDCFSRDIVRSVSIVPNGSTFENALNLVKRNPDIGVGIHLCLVGEKSILPKERISSIVDDKGFLPCDFYNLFFRICRNRINFSELKGELEAQINKVLDSGISPTHIDSHQYTHLIPPIFNIVVELAKKYCIRWVRYPGQERYIHITGMTAFMKKAYLCFLSRPQRRFLRKNNINYANFSYGILASGRLNESILKKFMESLGSGLNDITCHPGYSPKDKKYLSWKYRWDEEGNALRSDSIKALIRDLNIKLINYGRQ